MRLNMKSFYIMPFGNLAHAEEIGLKPDAHHGVTLVWSRFSTVEAAWAQARMIANWAAYENIP